MQATLQDLQKAVHRRHNKLHPERQRFTLLPPAGQKRGVVITPGKTLSSFGLKDGDELIFKDLGPQVSAQQRCAHGRGGVNESAITLQVTALMMRLGHPLLQPCTPHFRALAGLKAVALMQRAEHPGCW